MLAVFALCLLSACGGDKSDSPDAPVETATAAENDGLTDAQIAEQDASADLPGIFAPTQGRAHFNYTYAPDRQPRPFCEGVATSQTAGASAVQTAAVDCYATNPPTSGQHLPVQRNADVAPGASINIPPDPDVYPPDIEIPREAIAHILEHAGLFVGYNCATGDSACADVVTQLERIVNDRIDSYNDRVVMARDSDLPAGTIGLAAWTRVDTFPNGEFTQSRVVDFISAHSCRFDPEGFCSVGDNPVRGEGVERT